MQLPNNNAQPETRNLSPELVGSTLSKYPHPLNTGKTSTFETRPDVLKFADLGFIYEFKSICAKILSHNEMGTLKNNTK